MERIQQDVVTGVTSIVQYTPEEVAAEEAKLSIFNSVDNRKARLIVKCKADREAKTNTNETVPFPVDLHEIQTSNEIDIRNLLVKTTAAIAIAGAGGGSRNYSYTTAGEVRVTMTVQQFVNCALSIMAIKDQIFEDYETLRVAIDNAADSAALDAIEQNWPA